jgi:hypothetical protein
MTVAEEVNGWLRNNKGFAYCDGCIKNELNLSGSQQVQDATIALGTTGRFRRFTGTCFKCGEKRHLIQARFSN